MNWIFSIFSWLLSLFATRGAAKREGEVEAERKQATTSLAQAARATEVRAAADKTHASSAGDDAFDQEFRRS